MSPLDQFAAHPQWVAISLVALSVLIVSTLIAADIRSAHVRRSRPRHGNGVQPARQAARPGASTPHHQEHHTS